jgi:hypothetical protein
MELLMIHRHARRRLLLGSALAALAVPGAVNAQAFSATPLTVSGSVTYNRATPNVETITINSPSAIIDWRLGAVSPPLPSSFNFLPAGNTATFQNGIVGQNFAVLNRILPNGIVIRMDGNVVSQLQTSAGTIRGGTVIFSSPNGLIIGRSAVFDVGNLMLTSLRVGLDPSNEFIVGGRIQLDGGGQFATSRVVTEAGAQINAPADGSWVALVAPGIDHAGITRVNGSVAYVGAEGADLTINAGLFDIQITGGSSLANPVIHSGTTGGPASTGALDNHVIYMVAAPQNQAMTMLLAGDVGFDPAVSASVENGTIVLSSGHNVRGRTITPTPAPANTGTASISIPSGTWTSDVIGRARTDFLVGGTAPGSATFRQDLSIAAYNRAEITASGGFLVRVDGNATVSAANVLPVLTSPSLDVVGGSALIAAGSGGRIEILGSATVDASAVGATNGAGIAGDGSGGTASVISDKGSVDIGGNLTVVSTGTGGDDTDVPNVRGGNGSGGDVSVTALNGGTLRVGGNAVLDASGTASQASGAIAVRGSNGSGGDVQLSAGGGAITVQGSTTLRSTGTGGNVNGPAGTIGGTGQGGTAQITAFSGTADLTGPVTVVADGIGGRAPAGGTGNGGSASIDVTDGRIAAASTVTARANGTGGDAAFGSGGRGGDGIGGQASIGAHNGATPGTLTATAANLSASGTGGAGASGGGIVPGGDGGDGRGGDVVAVAEGGDGVLQPGALTGSSTGTGGNGGAGGALAGGRGGNGGGGTITAGTIEGRPIGAFAGRADFASAALSVDGAGGNGGTGAPGGAGGIGSGGGVTLLSTGAPVTVAGTANLSANGTGGLAPSGARSPAGGGSITVMATPAAGGPSGDLRIGTLIGNSIALGDAGPLNALGRWRIVADRSPILIGTAALNATATGVPGDVASSSIEATGARVTVTGTGTFASLGDVRLVADGAGQLVGGDITLRSGQAVTLSHNARPAGLLTVDANSFTVRAAGNYDAPIGTTVLGRNGVDIQAGGDAFLAQTASLATVRVAATGDVTLAGPLTGAAVDLSGRDVTVAATGSVGATNGVLIQAARAYSAAAGTLVQGGSVDIRAGTDATLAQTTATTGLLNIKAGGNVTVPAAVTGQTMTIAGQDVIVAAGGSLGSAGTGSLLVQAARDYLAAAGTTVQAASIDIRAGRDALLARTTSSGPLAVTAGGIVTVPAAVTGQTMTLSGQDVNVTAGGSLGNAGTVSVLVQAARDYSAAAGTIVRGTGVDIRAGRNAVLAQTTGTATLRVTAGSLARFLAAATAGDIRIASADIDVTASGSIGNAATTLTELQVQPGASATTLGGGAAGPGYTLTQDEANRVRGDTLRVTALSGAAGPTGSSQILVRDLVIAGRGAANGIAALEIATPGVVRVEGGLTLANALAGDRIALAAGNRVEVVAPGGGIRIRDAAGAPAGSLAIAANHIWVTDAATLAQLLADPAFLGRDTVLRTNNGPDTPRGYVEAGTIRLAPNTTLFVQNSGTAIDFAGLTVGAGGLTIVPSGNQRAIVYAFGRQLNADGTATLNIPFFRQVNFSRGASAGYTNPSEFNRCIINTGFCSGAVPQGPLTSRSVPTGPFLLPPQEPPGDPLDISAFAAEPLIEEPVTSGSDSTLWADPFGDDDDDDDDDDESEGARR